MSALSTPRSRRLDHNADTRSGSEQGIFFDMKTNLCTWNNELASWPRKWYPLEPALRFWLAQYENGKFSLPMPISDGGMGNHGQESYTPHDLELNLAAYYNLVTAIAARIPDSTIGAPGLISAEMLDRFHIHGFRRDFLLQARKPSFEFKAPGIRIPISTWLEDLLEADHGSKRYLRVRDDNHGLVPNDDDTENAAFDGDPFPLFPGPLISSTTPGFEHVDGDIRGGKFIVGSTSRLYLWPERSISADHARFIMLYPVNQNGFMDKGNPGYRPGKEEEVPEWMVRDDRLYEHGYCPFGLPHPPRLFGILENWSDMVRSGKWEVDEKGV